MKSGRAVSIFTFEYNRWNRLSTIFRQLIHVILYCRLMNFLYDSLYYNRQQFNIRRVYRHAIIKLLYHNIWNSVEKSFHQRFTAGLRFQLFTLTFPDNLLQPIDILLVYPDSYAGRFRREFCERLC